MASNQNLIPQIQRALTTGALEITPPAKTIIPPEAYALPTKGRAPWFNCTRSWYYAAEKQEYASTGTDAPDGIPEVHPDCTQPPVAKPVDPIVLEYGPLFSFGKDTVHANQLAITAKFSRDHQVRFDSDAAEYVRYEPALGLWGAVKESDLKVALARFVKFQAEENDAIDFLPKRTNSFLGAVFQLLKGFASPQNGARPLGILHVGNGMLDLTQESLVVGAFDANHWSRRMCSIVYRSEAKCARFLDELLNPALVTEDVDLLQRVFGSALLGENSAQRFLIVSGEAARGKSTVVTMLERILGLENVAHLRTDHLTMSLDVSKLQNVVKILEWRDPSPLPRLCGGGLQSQGPASQDFC